jgi:hypothetical protein
MRRAGCHEHLEKRHNSTGNFALIFFVSGKKSSMGTAYPMGIPNRWALPTTISAPHSPGGFNNAKLKMSAATATNNHFRGRDTQFRIISNAAIGLQDIE